MGQRIWWYFVPLLTLSLLVATPSIQAQTVVFHRRSAEVGEATRHDLRCDLSLNLSIQQSGQIVQQQEQSLVRSQQRELKITRTSNGLPVEAQVHYRESSVSLQLPEQEAAPAPQPVSGKTYRVIRQGAELLITYPDGTSPAEGELQLVQQNLQTFGLPNPIAKFFDGRKVSVGETLELPADLAEELLGFAQTADNVNQFRMTLQQIRPARAPAPSMAIFALEMRADDAADTGVSLQLNGQLAMEIETCRAVGINLRGPVKAIERHGPAEAQYEVHTDGNIQVAIRATAVR